MRRAIRWLVAIGCLWSVLLVAAERPTVGQESAQEPRGDRRLVTAHAAVQARPNDPQVYRLRAALYAERDQHERAIEDLDRAIALDPQLAGAYDERGSQHFMLGHIQASIDDFDRFIKLRPDQERGHWKRGISYYYAGRYEDGRRQFESYQMVDDNDVENAVWRYLCMARGQSPEAARDALLSIRRDGRVPMMEVYALYGGKGSAEDVLTACAAGSPSAEALSARLFYAHLYLGLYYEANDRGNQAREHITRAAKEHRIGHYMWHVANVHAKLLERAAP